MSDTTIYLAPPSSGSFVGSALNDAVAQACETGKKVKLLPGDFNFDKPLWLNLPKEAPQIYGSGRGSTFINFPNAQEGDTQFHITSPSDFYDLVLKGFFISSSHNGTLLKIGQDDYRDPLNCARIEDLGVFNGKAGATDSVAIHLNYVVNSKFGTVRANCFANGQGANYGTALLLRQAAFNQFSSTSFGNASYGICMKDGFTYGNVFSANDTENVNNCIELQSENAISNIFLGGQYSLFNNYLINNPFQNSSRTRVRMDLCNIQMNPGSQFFPSGFIAGLSIQQ